MTPKMKCEICSGSGHLHNSHRVEHCFACKGTGEALLEGICGICGLPRDECAKMFKRKMDGKCQKDPAEYEKHKVFLKVFDIELDTYIPKIDRRP